MIIVKTTQELISVRSALKGTLALVTTMGNLHQGHLSLVKKAQTVAEKVIVTIYINPMQFSENEDLSTYPRTLDDDIQQLESLGVDLLFTPTDDVMYPEGLDTHTQIVVPNISYLYCGAHRQGHFIGVSTIVCKLFNLIKPDIAIFGNKDFQQLKIIQKMVNDLAMPIELIGMPTYREKSGLAMSSRNKYLSPVEKIQAANLYKTLQWAEEQLHLANYSIDEIESLAKKQLYSEHFDIEFFTICQREHLTPAKKDNQWLVILAALKFAKPRLIDNVIVDLSTDQGII